MQTILPQTPTSLPARFVLFLCPTAECGGEEIVDKKPTKKQGQYLAFIFYYTKVNGRPPAEADIQRHFRVTPPSVHQMILSLEQYGFVSRTPGQARSIRVLLPREGIPDLE